MKIDYSIQYHSPKFDIELWLKEIEPDVNKSKSKHLDYIYQHYFELVEDFKSFLRTSEKVEDSIGKKLTPIDIYNAIEYYKVRIEKLLLILDLRLYMTHNVNKETQVRYIVMRAMWIDENGKPYRKFSKNLGSEAKVLVRGKIPVKVLESVEDYIQTLMWDQYYFEHISDAEAGIDSDGNLRIPRS